MKRQVVMYQLGWCRILQHSLNALINPNAYRAIVYIQYLQNYDQCLNVLSTRQMTSAFVFIMPQHCRHDILPISEIISLLQRGCLFRLVHATMKTMVDKICAFTTSSHYDN